MGVYFFIYKIEVKIFDLLMKVLLLLKLIVFYFDIL